MQKSYEIRVHLEGSRDDCKLFSGRELIVITFCTTNGELKLDEAGAFLTSTVLRRWQEVKSSSKSAFCSAIDSRRDGLIPIEIPL